MQNCHSAEIKAVFLGCSVKETLEGVPPTNFPCPASDCLRVESRETEAGVKDLPRHKGMGKLFGTDLEVHSVEARTSFPIYPLL